MYAYIKGIVASVSEDSVVVECGGIGYRLFVPSHALESVSVGDERKFHTHFAVREDAMLLYGFLTEDDLQIFRMLLGVGGVGPKGAIGILSSMDADDLRFAILAEDAAGISRAPGIGRKTAQKVILELKDKLDLEDAFTQKARHTEEAAALAAGSPQSEAVLALAALGYTNTEASKAVKRVMAAGQETADTETLIRLALKELI